MPTDQIPCSPGRSMYLPVVLSIDALFQFFSCDWTELELVFLKRKFSLEPPSPVVYCTGYYYTSQSLGTFNCHRGMATCHTCMLEKRAPAGEDYRDPVLVPGTNNAVITNCDR